MVDLEAVEVWDISLDDPVLLELLPSQEAARVALRLRLAAQGEDAIDRLMIGGNEEDGWLWSLDGPPLLAWLKEGEGGGNP